MWHAGISHFYGTLQAERLAIRTMKLVLKQNVPGRALLESLQADLRCSRSILRRWLNGF
jgi:hypothetical protein